MSKKLTTLVKTLAVASLMVGIVAGVAWVSDNYEEEVTIASLYVAGLLMILGISYLLVLMFWNKGD